MKKHLTLLWTLVLSVSVCSAARKHRSWLEHALADAKTATRVNPYEGQVDSVQAGEKLFQRYCSSCHGKDAQGLGRNPSLHSPTMKGASPGALFWLLRNGSLSRGMPSWSYLPPEQRWQLVTWIKSL